MSLNFSNPSSPRDRGSLVRRGIGEHGWPPATEWLLVAIVFLLPWQARWIWYPRMLNGAFWEYGSFSLYAIEALVWVCLILAAVRAMRNGFSALPRLSWKKFLQPSGVIFIGVIMLLAAAWSSLLWAPDRMVALQTAFRLTESIALFYVFVLAKKTTQQYAGVAWAVAAGLQGVVAISQYFTQEVLGSTWFGMAPQWPGMLGASVVELADGRWLRAYGTFPHPNILAGFLALGIIFSLRWYVARYYHADRIVALFCGVLASLGITFSFSRSGGLAVASGVLIWLVFEISRRHWQDAGRIFRFLVLTLVVAGVAVWVALPLFQARVSGIGRLELKSTAERQILLQEGVSLALQSLPLGVGAGNATVESSRVTPKRPGWDYQPVHNIFILSLLELGIAGIISLLVIFFSMIWLAVWRHSWASLGILCALFILGWFDHYLWSLFPGNLMLFLGLAFSTSTLDNVKTG